MHNTYCDPHKQHNQAYYNSRNQEIYNYPDGYNTSIDYVKLVDELLRRIRQDAGYRYELPGYPKGSYKYEYNIPATCQANNENQNVGKSQVSNPKNYDYDPWMN